MNPNNSFHATVETARASQLFTQNAWRWAGHYVSLRVRNLTYRVSPHYHPYVAQLIQRLNEGGVASLEQAETIYLPQPNPPQGQAVQPTTILPNSTRATLLADVTASRPDGGSVALPSGTPVTLPDLTTITVKAGTRVTQQDGGAQALPADLSFTLPGVLPMSSSAGIQTGSAPTAPIVPDSTEVTVTLSAGTYAMVSADSSQVRLPDGTAVTLRSGLPQPLFYLDDFQQRYNPNIAAVQTPMPVNELDFSLGGAYSIYNWELFFHAPLLIAVHLSQNQKFQEAQDWFHYIFDPTDDSADPSPQRFWKIPLFRFSDAESIEQILINLAQPQDMQLFNDTVESITEWRDNPFQPWAVARYRVTSYMLKTVMAYLDNLIAWGDSLFQQYTIETINEATQLYVMAANILGPKPQAVPKKGAVKTLTYNDLRNLDPFGNAMVDMESDIPFDMFQNAGTGADQNGSQILGSVGQTLYFCIPRNDVLLGYWDTVADRLFKIHNSLNLQGVFQRPPLYDPPIDPALLVRAAAAGLDVSSVISGATQPLPLVRFQYLIAKATEICGEVRSLGQNLLSAIEKRDNEAIALLRSQHENAIFGLANVVKYAQWQESIKATQAAQASLDSALQRYRFYQTLLGRTESDIANSLPQMDELVSADLQALNYTQADPDPMPLDSIDPDLTRDSIGTFNGGQSTLNTWEADEQSGYSKAIDAQLSAGAVDAVGAVLALIPNSHINAEPLGTGVTVQFGGHQFSWSSSKTAAVARTLAEIFAAYAGQSGRLGSYHRRVDEWKFQSNIAKSDINQILKQLRGAQIREAIAEAEYNNHQIQMQQAQQMADFLQGSFSNSDIPPKETTVGFYALMKRDLKGLYTKAFQLAFDTAKKAERALQNELGDSTLSFVQFNYLDGNQGLLAGDKLMFDLKTMEIAYADLNRREYELTKHVSLRQVDPMALVQLRATGTCSFIIPEEALDLDCPGHYFRRMRSVALTLPCVTGPYTGVNCTLSLQRSSIRIKPGLTQNKYARQGSDDDRFDDYLGTIQSIVTSSGQGDSGLFETNLHDERYLPFENAGIAGSQWQLNITAEVRQFDFDTITDVILHVRYTSRDGGDTLRAAAVANLQGEIAKGQTVGSVCLFSVRHDFPSAWAKFKSATPAPTAALQLAFRPEHYPFWSQGIVGTAPLKGFQLIAEMPSSSTATAVKVADKADQSGNSDSLAKNIQIGNLFVGALTNISRPPAISDPAGPPFTLYLDSNAMDDLWLAITWGSAA